MNRTAIHSLALAVASALLATSVHAGPRVIQVGPGGSTQVVTQGAQGALPPLDLSDMRLWNYAGKWHASQWDNAFSPIPWRFDHVKKQSDGSAVFTLDSRGAPELQAVNGTPAYDAGLWETDVTLPPMRDGMIVAPLWIYDKEGKDEIDFEFAGRRGLDVSMHTYVNGQHLKKTIRVMPGDFSGRRMRFGIKLNTKAGVVDMFVDGNRVLSATKAQIGFFTRAPMRPFIEMWAANPTDKGFVAWAGKWTGLGAGENVLMTVHGYRYTPQ